MWRWLPWPRMLAREQERGNLLVHTLVSRTMRFRDADSERRAALHLADTPCAGGHLGDDIFDVRLHARLSDPVAHSRVALAATLSDASHAKVADARLLDALYIYDSCHGNYQSARRIAACLVEYSRAQLGPEHAHTLIFMTYLGRTLGLMGDLPEALATHEQVFEVSCRTLGENDPRTLTALSDIALTLFKQGDLLRARSLQEQVLEQRVRVLGEDDVDTLTAMNNLALTLATQGHFGAARPLQERVWKGAAKCSDRSIWRLSRRWAISPLRSAPLETRQGRESSKRIGEISHQFCRRRRSGQADGDE